MLTACTFLLTVLCVRVKTTSYNPLEYREPTRGMKDLMLKIDSCIVDLMIEPKTPERGIYLMKFLIGYDGLMDRTIQLLKEKKVKGYEIFQTLREMTGPMFVRVRIESLIQRMLSDFKWTGKRLEKFNELIEKTKFKWFQVRTLGKRMIDELPS